MWTVDQIKIRDGTVYFAFTKIGDYVQNPPEEVRLRLRLRIRISVRQTSASSTPPSITLYRPLSSALDSVIDVRIDGIPCPGGLCLEQ